MYSLIIAILAGGGAGYGLFSKFGPVWGLTGGIAVVVLLQLAIGLWIRRKVNAINVGIQREMESAQARINRKVQLFQQRGGGNMRQAQQTLEREQMAAVRQALEMTDAVKPYYAWNLLLEKQINTMRMMLHFQIKEFNKVDELLPKCMFMESRSIAVKMVRMYKKEDATLDKFYAKKCRRTKGEDCAFLASLYAWIQLKKGDNKGALQTLISAKERSDNAVLLANWERLVNGKVKHFSNSGFGDLWYSLYLEEPKMKQQRVQQARY